MGGSSILLLVATIPLIGFAKTAIESVVESPAIERSALKAGFSWRECVSPEWQNTTFPFTADLKTRAECLPDTLYAWRSKSGVARLAETSRRGPGLWPLIESGSGLFFWRTPLGSYGYGDVPIRVKLRPNTLFIPYVPVYSGSKDFEQRRCETLRAKYGPSVADRAVFVARINRMFSATPSELLNSYYEFILCSDAAVDSWSTGTAEGRMEILREKRWIETHPMTDYDALIRDASNNTYWVNPAVNDDIEQDDGRKIKSWIFDGHDWSSDSLDPKIAGLKDQLPGEIFFARDVTPSRANHFRTAQPGYFNPLGPL